MRRTRGAAGTAVMLAMGMVLAGGGEIPGQATKHDRAFWRSIVASGYSLPEGTTAAGLLDELGGLLGSRDPEERDTFGYGIAARWIYSQRLCTPAELRGLVAAWSENLRRGLGESGTDSVLLRSFSALNLSIIAALDNEAPFLEKDESGALLDAALAYMRDERDVRGFDPPLGWLHSAAHTSDLLKFLGRSRHLEPSGQARILDAIAAKQAAPGGLVYAFGEDERMARAVLSIARRADLDTAGFEGWLGRLAGRADGLWEGTLDPARFAEVQNVKNMLRSLFVLLSVEAEKEGAAATVRHLRTRVLETLTRL